MPMYKVRQIMISPYGKKKALYKSLSENMHTAKLVYNQALFYIRNLYTGLKKASGKRTGNEQMVIENVRKYIAEINEKNKRNGRTQYALPDADSPILSKNLLVSVMTRVFRDHFPFGKLCRRN